MQITSGRFRGRKLLGPQDNTIRPTSQRLRAAVFDILTHRYHLDYSQISVLDLFAGTGALGLEVMSRGGHEAIFVDNSPVACALIHSNIKRLDLSHCTAVLCKDASAAARHNIGQPFGLVFADPPYATPDKAWQALGNNAKKNRLAPGALCLVETALGVPCHAPSGFELMDIRRSGRTEIKLLQFAPGDNRLDLGGPVSADKGEAIG